MERFSKKPDKNIKTVESKRFIKVVSSSQKDNYISSNDAEMDARARQAVRAAVEKARFCKNPVAGYDLDTKKAYVEYSNGEKKYVN